MKQMMSLPLYSGSFAEYQGWEDLRAELNRLGCDGLEGVWGGEEFPPDLPAELVVGYHLTAVLELAFVEINVIPQVESICQAVVGNIPTFRQAGNDFGGFKVVCHQSIEDLTDYVASVDGGVLTHRIQRFYGIRNPYDDIAAGCGLLHVARIAGCVFFRIVTGAQAHSQA